MKYALLKIALTLMIVSISVLSKAQAVYNFDNLTLYVLLNGQDNWVDQIGQGNAAIYMDATATNGTKIVRPMATVIFNQPAYITRINDSVFNFPQFTGAETDAVMQFDATGDHIAIFALGYDVNNDGKLDSAAGEIGPAFGTWDQNFAILTANLDSIIEEPLGSGNGVFDWYRIQLHIDFTANGGLGSGSLYYLNLSDGDSIYIPVAGLENINLQLNNMNVNAAPQNWNTMWLQLLAGGGNEPAVDNLVPSVSGTTNIQEINSTEVHSVLEPNFPNPFSTFTTIRYFISDQSMVTINVFDSHGMKLFTIVNEIVQHGLHDVFIDGTDLSNGIYYYQIETEKISESRKMVRIK